LQWGVPVEGGKEKVKASNILGERGGAKLKKLVDGGISEEGRQFRQRNCMLIDLLQRFFGSKKWGSRGRAWKRGTRVKNKGKAAAQGRMGGQVAEGGVVPGIRKISKIPFAQEGNLARGRVPLEGALNWRLKTGRKNPPIETPKTLPGKKTGL